MDPCRAHLIPVFPLPGDSQDLVTGFNQAYETNNPPYDSPSWPSNGYSSFRFGWKYQWLLPSTLNPKLWPVMAVRISGYWVP